MSWSVIKGESSITKEETKEIVNKLNSLGFFIFDKDEYIRIFQKLINDTLRNR